MVGVPGKYKGCNTCRTRRVKCDNERPFCRKCLDTGRTCDGYKRETVFIIGTLQDQGRCSSHPPRVVKSSKKGGSKASSKKDAVEKLELVANEPLRPAWDDLISVSNAGKTYNIQNAALHTKLDQVTRRAGSHEGGGGDGDDNSSGALSNYISLPNYEPPNVHVQPFGMSEGDFQLRSQALVHLSPLEETQGEGLQTATTDSICMFLYEHNNSNIFNNQAPWRDPTIQNDNVRRLGPAAFRTFPNHHFFVRVFRHNAICTALLNRTPTFLESPEWITTPWELHPKTLYDQLFDIIVLLPSVLHRADRILLAGSEPNQHQQSHHHMMARRLMAQDLLQNCLNIERQFDEWYAAAAAHSANQNGSDMYWVDEDGDGGTPGGGGGGGGGSSSSLRGGSSSGVPSPSPSNTTTSSSRSKTSTNTSTSTATRTAPFTETFAFPDPLTSLMCIYAWTGLVQLYLCIERLYWAAAAFEPGSSPSSAGAAAALAQINLLQYSLKVREMVGNICRSLDFALESTVQPDMLAVPLAVVKAFYEENASVVGAAAATSLDPSLGMGMGVNLGFGFGGPLAMEMGGLGMGMGMGFGGGGDIGGGLLGDGRMELIWCEGFRERLRRKGRDIAEVVMGRRWVDLGSY